MLQCLQMKNKEAEDGIGNYPRAWRLQGNTEEKCAADAWETFDLLFDSKCTFVFLY